MLSAGLDICQNGVVKVLPSCIGLCRVCVNEWSEGKVDIDAKNHLRAGEELEGLYAVDDENAVIDIDSHDEA